MTSPQTLQLDRSIWNESLYTSLRTTWFAGLPPSRKCMNDITAKRWWGKDASDQEKTAFDEECRRKFSHALESIAPDKIALPDFQSYSEEDIALIAAPFIKEIEEMNTHDDEGRKGMERLVALVLLLDQVARNIYRDNEGLRLVYRHYDRLAWSLVKAASALAPKPSDNTFLRGNTAWGSWLMMPLMHAEDLASQEECLAYAEKLRREAKEDGDEETVGTAEFGVTFSEKHRDIVARFGVFPHRSYCLKREVSEEEEKWLRESGETFGVKIEKEDDGKEEL